MGLLSLSVFAGLLYGNRRGLILAGLNVIAVLAHAIAEARGWLGTPKLMFLPTFLAIETAYQMAWVGTLLAVATGSVRSALTQVVRELDERRRSEEALRQSEENYRAVFNATSDGLIVYDLEAGRATDVNLAMLKLYGLASKEEALACSAGDLSAGTPPYTQAEGRNHLERAIKNGLETYEWRARKKTGELFWAEIATRCFEINGRRLLIASIRDVTERKRNEEDLRRSEGRLEAAQAHARIGSWELQSDLTTIACSRQMYHLLNLDPASKPLSQAEFIELIHPEDRDAARRAQEQALNSAELTSVELRTDPARGPVRVLSANMVTYRDAAGRLLHMAGTLQDVTEHRLAKEGLRESEERFRSLVESAPETIFVASLGRIAYLNPAMLRLLGASQPGEVLGLQIEEVVAPESYGDVCERIRRMRESREPAPLMEQTYVRRDGSRVPVETTAVGISWEGQDACLVFVRDITERKRAEAELNQERDFSQTLVRSSPAYFVAIALDGRIRMMNEALLNALGYSAEEVINRDFATTCVPERERDVFTEMHQQICTSNLATHGEGHVVAKDGRELLVEWHGCGIGKNGAPDYALGVGIDITERRQAEVRIQQQAALLAASHDAILVWEPGSGIQYMNPAAEELTGQSFAQAQARDLFAVLSPQPEQALQAAIREVAELGHWSGELTLRAGGNTTRVVASRWTALNNSEGKSSSVLITSNDITEQKQLESQYMRVQRLESVGTLASGIAHDLNNILSPVVLGVELLEPRTTDQDTRVVLQMMRDSAQRGADTVRQLLTFARGSEPQKGPVQPRHLLKEIVRLLQQTFPKNIQIHTKYSEQLDTVQADPSQLHQVLMNLSVNARDAMPDGGVMRLTLENRTLDDSGARMHPKARPIPYVVFEVSDSGTGIPPEMLDRIFDPFFTTKPQGKGTGLGLAMVLGIVENHGGFVTVDSKPGQGATFQAFLPARTGTAAREEESRPPAPPPGEGEIVLVVDDEPAILHLAAQILQHAGYATLLATNASEALHLCEQGPERIRAVLTDIMMPFGDGRQLIAMLHQRHPALPIIAMSGMATSDFQQETLRRGARAFVRKPFVAEELLRPLADVLRKAPD
jgi:PAS domain S-box-containing protein